ncbi:transcription termination factor Rho [Raoultibacter massiliensis]|uniref:Transcription termination factor Rho n=1 Tax=Raoultibacter massiliensis TaxID=1852371 RepID=A0ABV1JCR8_9ACTN|nr:transcription termination factor Rho [Raoultibacter massiliensis]
MSDTETTVAAEAAPTEEKAPAKRKPRARKTATATDAAAPAEQQAPEAANDPEAEKKPARKPRAKRVVVETGTAAKVQGESSSDSATDEPKRPAARKRAAAKQPEEKPAAESKPEEQSAKQPVEQQSERQPDDRQGAQRQRTNQNKNKQQNQNNQNQNKNKQNNKQQNNRQQNGGGNNANQRKQRRQHQGSNREPVVPQTTREDIEKLKVAELRAKAEELSLDVTGLLKADLIEKVYEACVKAEGFIEVKGVLDILADGYGFLRTQGYLPSETDAYVGLSTIRRNGLRKGDFVVGQTRPPRENEKYAAVQKILSINGKSPEALGKRVRFADLTPVYPDERLWMEHGKTTITARVIDLAAPIGKGQRGLIVSPPKAGKTTVLKDIAASISANNPEVHLMCLLVDERPEEVTDMERSIRGEVISSTFDMPCENHIAVSELVIERAKRLVEEGADVVILLDSLTRLARAYNLAQPASGRILSGGVDSTALYPPKRFLGAARNIEGGGSLTILASALVETGSKMDEVIFEEFKGTGNMELRLDRSLADRRIFPAIDPVSSGTRKEDLLLEPQEAPLIWAVRRILANMNSTERAMDMLIKSLKQTSTNQEFLLRTAKKAQLNKSDENFEL